MAYRTLHYILIQSAMAVATFTPFLAEELFKKLTGGEIGESVHLLGWPESGYVDGLVLNRMADVRAEGLMREVVRLVQNACKEAGLQ